MTKISKSLVTLQLWVEVTLPDDEEPNIEVEADDVRMRVFTMTHSWLNITKVEVVSVEDDSS